MNLFLMVFCYTYKPMPILIIIREAPVAVDSSRCKVPQQNIRHISRNPAETGGKRL